MHLVRSEILPTIGGYGCTGYGVSNLWARCIPLNYKYKPVFLFQNSIICRAFLNRHIRPHGMCYSHFGNWVYMYSRVHKSSDSFFSKILEKPSIVQKKIIPQVKAKVVLIGKKQKHFSF